MRLRCFMLHRSFPANKRECKDLVCCSGAAACFFALVLFEVRVKRESIGGSILCVVLTVQKEKMDLRHPFCPFLLFVGYSTDRAKNKHRKARMK